MPIDLNAVPAATRSKQIRLGQQFGSQDTLDQANQTLHAYAVHGVALTPYGFTTLDAERLADARDLLLADGVGRQTARGQKKVTSQAYADAVKAGQAARLSARSILTGVEEDIEESAAPGAEDAARLIAAALRTTRAGSDQAEKLAQQLDQLASTLQHAAVAPVAASRGGADAIARLTAASAALRKADQDDATVRGTPAETQRLDQIDGIIVRLARRARHAALAAARATGDAALVEAFKLDKLYQSRAPSSAAGEDLDPEADDAPDETEAD